MKKLSIMAFLFVASLGAQTSFSGIWNGSGGIASARYGTVPQTSQMTLLQAGSSVTGTFKLGNGPLVTITSGTVTGSQINIVVGNGIGTGALTANGSQLVGTMTSATGMVVNFVFTQLK